MGIIINSTDFTGKHRVSKDLYAELDKYIIRYERRYLIDMVGLQVANLFIGDLVLKVPQAPIYLAIYNEIYMQEMSCGCSSNRTEMYSAGIKDMLIGFIYFEYMRDLKYRPTSTGIVVNQNEVSREVANPDAIMYSRYNDSVEAYNVIRRYCRLNNYVGLLGSCKQYANTI